MLRPRSLSSSRSASERFRTERDSAIRVAICTSPIIHLICSPKFCIAFVFHFSWVSQSSEEKLKTMLMQNFGGQIRLIMRDVQVAYAWQKSARTKRKTESQKSWIISDV